MRNDGVMIDLESLFARRVLALGRPGGVALAISTSGNGENVVRGRRAAAEAGMAAVLGGRGGGRMNRLADPLLVAPSEDAAAIQEMPVTLGHMPCPALEGDLR